MELHLTEGMFGKSLKVLVEDADETKTILEGVFAFKNSLENQKKYKIEKYDRLIFRDTEVAIDFGDYSTFMLIKNISSAQKKQLIGN